MNFGKKTDGVYQQNGHLKDVPVGKDHKATIRLNPETADGSDDQAMVVDVDSLGTVQIQGASATVY